MKSNHRQSRPEQYVGVLLLIGLFVSAFVYGVLQFKHLSYPLLWQDEGETVMFGQRILEYGYPRAIADGNLVYGTGAPFSYGLKQKSDAYIWSLWGQYYFAALGVKLAEQTDDIRAKTAFLRLPFAMAGCMGLICLFLSFFLLNKKSSKEWIAYAMCYTMLIAFSTSLILHMREVRYYSLVVFLYGIILWCEFRHSRRDNKKTYGPFIIKGAAIVTLFNVFYPACLAICGWLGLESILRLCRRKNHTSIKQGFKAFAQDILFLSITAVFMLPSLIYFEIPTISSAMRNYFQFDLALYFKNLGLIFQYLFRFEYLGLMLLVKGMLLSISKNKFSTETREMAAASACLLRLCILYVLVNANNPIFFERYHIVLSPIIVLILLLDFRLLLQYSCRLTRKKWMVRLGGLLIAVCFATTLWVKRTEVTGYCNEISTPHLGPLDYVIPHLKGQYEDTGNLIVLTNYEAEVLMYYLGCRVVGRTFAETNGTIFVPETLDSVDVVIPRKHWDQSSPLFDLFHTQEVRRHFKKHSFPVRDVAFNNIPELFRGEHRFQTPVSTDPSTDFSVYQRIDGS